MNKGACSHWSSYPLHSGDQVRGRYRGQLVSTLLTLAKGSPNSHVTLLDKILRRGGTTEVDKYYAKGKDHGATVYCHLTKPKMSLPAYPSGSGELCMYIARHLPKLKTLIYMADRIYNDKNRKLLSFCDWRLTQWNAGMFLKNGDAQAQKLWIWKKFYHST